MSPEALRQHLNTTLLKKGFAVQMRVYIRIIAIWAYNEGLKARANVLPTCPDLGGCDGEEHS